MIGHPLQRLHRAGVFGWLYLGMLFLSFFFFSLQYINSAFLEQYVPVTQVGLLFGIASALSVLLLGITPTLISCFGIYRTTTALLLILYTTTLVIASQSHVGVLFVAWTLYFLLMPVVFFSFDIFLENSIQNETQTGGIRGILLTMGTLAALAAPLLASMIVGEGGYYQSVFLLAAVFLIPLFFIVAYRFREFRDPPYNTIRLGVLFRTLKTDSNMRNVTFTQFILRMYFAGMTIYMPVYLHEYIGFSWEQIGILLFVMLLPYLLLEIPTGILADKKLGEKEMLLVGICITAVSTAVLSFMPQASMLLWGAGLFMTRVGSSLINTMSEVYFFKKVDGRHTDVITTFRLMRPLAFMVGPLAVSALLLVLPLSMVWLALGIFAATGIPAALALEDTR